MNRNDVGCHTRPEMPHLFIGISQTGNHAKIMQIKCSTGFFLLKIKTKHRQECVGIHVTNPVPGKKHATLYTFIPVGLGIKQTCFKGVVTFESFFFIEKQGRVLVPFLLLAGIVHHYFAGSFSVFTGKQPSVSGPPRRNLVLFSFCHFPLNHLCFLPE